MGMGWGFYEESPFHKHAHRQDGKTMRKILLMSTIVLGVAVAWLSPPSWTPEARVVLVTNIKQYTGLSTDTKPTLTTTDAGSSFFETNTTVKYTWNGSAWVTSSLSSQADTTTMSAPGTSSAISADGASGVSWSFVVASINTSVTVALQRKAGDGEWTNVWADSLTYTANDAYSLDWTDAALADSLRFRWISEAGGTDATITHTSRLIGGN